MGNRELLCEARTTLARRNRVPRPVSLLLVVAAVLVSLLGAAGQTHAAFPGANGRIAFASNRPGSVGYDIWTMDAAGGSPLQLTNATGDDEYPAWSPDGSKIAFSSNRTGNSELYVMNADGSSQTRLTYTSSNNYEPAWSNDGTQVAFRSNRSGADEIWVLKVSDGSVRRLTFAGGLNPAWSPDGGRIAFTCGPADFEICVTNADGTGAPTDLTNNPAWDSNPKWVSATQIAFQSNRDGNFEVYVMNAADGSGQTNRSNTPSAFDSAPAPSPDGALIAFQTNRNHNPSNPNPTFEIYVMNAADGSSPTNLTNDNTVIDRLADWQPVPAFDTTPPFISCTAPPNGWSATNISVACTASDGGSGLANAGDAAFTLDTNVPQGAEDANAVTPSHSVCDLNGNCALAGPFTGLKIDRRSPSITLSAPAASAVLVLAQPLSSTYSCADGGSGIATCAGPVANGSAIDTATVGAKPFNVSAADQVGNAALAGVSYTVSFGVNVARTKPAILLQLVNYTGANVSAAAITVTVLSIDGAPVSGQTFAYKNGSYSYKPGTPKGPHTLTFAATGDPIVHQIAFTS